MSGFSWNGCQRTVAGRPPKAFSSRRLPMKHQGQITSEITSMVSIMAPARLSRSAYPYSTSLGARVAWLLKPRRPRADNPFVLCPRPAPKTYAVRRFARPTLHPPRAAGEAPTTEGRVGEACPAFGVYQPSAQHFRLPVAWSPNMDTPPDPPNADELNRLWQHGMH